MDKPEKIFGSGILIEFLVTGVFLLVLFLRPKAIVEAGCVYALVTLLNFSICYIRLHREVRTTLQKVDDTIQSLVDGAPVQMFDAAQESLLGKFQSQIIRLYRILLAHKEQEKKLREDLSTLVADLVHQINTPLANIEMYVDFLMQEGLDGETREKFLKNVKSQTEKLGWFGEGFDKAARLETDIISLKPARAALLPAVLSAIDEASLKAKLGGNEICLEGDTSIEAVYDRKWTVEALFNLLDNAVKYGKEGAVIRVRLSAYQLYVRVDVESEGAIIPAQEQTDIFRRFYRGSSAAMVQDGVGLGLYLVREIIAGQGGYVLLEKWENKGNRFSIFLRNGK